VTAKHRLAPGWRAGLLIGGLLVILGPVLFVVLGLGVGEPVPMTTYRLCDPRYEEPEPDFCAEMRLITPPPRR
jgi:hypothetical protein